MAKFEVLVMAGFRELQTHRRDLPVTKGKRAPVEKRPGALHDGQGFIVAARLRPYMKREELFILVFRTAPVADAGSSEGDVRISGRRPVVHA